MIVRAVGALLAMIVGAVGTLLAMIGAMAAPPTSSTAAPTLLSTGPLALAALEKNGLGVGATGFKTAGAVSNADLAKDSAYLDVVYTLSADLDELYKLDKAWGPGMRFTHRGFDKRWLTSKDARWELAAVVNRVDRKVFDAATCGEVRFIYRLAYTTETKSGPFSSRIPATLNVVYLLPNTDDAACKKAAERFTRAIDASVITGASLKSVEVDMQTARWPSTVRPDLGGHADYVLRVFHANADRTHLKAAPLENTPDVDKLAKDPAARKELAKFLADHVADIDKGTLVVPEKFLATRAVSVTPRGLARPQNRPWSRLFGDGGASGDAGVGAGGAVADEFASVYTAASSWTADRKYILRRLDGLSCMGCHQSRSLAGFHVVGADRAGGSVVALAVGLSPHLEEDLPRRAEYVKALLEGRATNERRREPDHEIDRGTFGDSCALSPSFSGWNCAAGFTCTAVDDADVGECMPVAASSGSACRTGVVDKRDRITKSTEHACQDAGFCEDVPVGFPGGMCGAPCGTIKPGDHAACGGVAVLTPFNQCLARGELFSTCAKHQTPVALRACGPNDPCRPDYICAGGGVCLPPYFVLQMRVDGHPLK